MFFKPSPSSSARFYPVSGFTTQQRPVLIVDDHPAIRVAVRSAMTKLDGVDHIIEAADGPDAVEKFKKYQPLLVILDLNLPGMDGLSLMRHLIASGQHSKYLVYSGLDANIYATRARKAGANGFISKMHGLEIIESAARSVINGVDCFPMGTSELQEPDQTAIHRLSNREMTILSYLIKGVSNKEIADKLFIDAKTVSTYKNRILKKTKAKNVVDLIYLCQEHWKVGQN